MEHSGNKQSLMQRLGQPSKGRRFLTLVLCLLVISSLAWPYISYPTPIFADDAAEQLAIAEANAAYDEEVLAYQADLRTLEDAQRILEEIEPKYSVALGELNALLGTEEEAADTEDPVVAAKQAEVDALNEQIIEARKVTRRASSIVEPVPVQHPLPAKTDDQEAVTRHNVSGFSLIVGKLTAATAVQVAWTLLPGMILLLASIALAFSPRFGKWRMGALVLGAMLVISSALRINTATAKELGAVSSVYSYGFGYAIAIVASLLAVLSAVFENKTLDLSLKGIRRFALDKAIYLVLLLLVIVIAAIRPKFFSVSTLLNILQQSSTRLIIAMGMSFVIIGTGGVDLSCSRMVGMAAVVSASMLQTSDYSRLFFPSLPLLPVFLPFLAAMLIALLFGLLNGTIISKLSVPPFITTLATQVIVYGATSIYFDMTPNNSQPIGGLRSDFTFLGSGTIYGFIPIVVIVALIVCVAIWFVQNKTVFGKNVFAIGGNPEAAKVSGINVTVTIIAIFALASTLIGMAGVLEAARTGGATNNYGVGYELDAIAACVVGGVSSSGGVGTVGGVISGVLIFQVINYGLTFLNVNPYWQQIIKGIIIASAVALDIRKYVGKK